MYIERERPTARELRLETLVKMVQGAREAKTDAKHGMEQFSRATSRPLNAGARSGGGVRAIPFRGIIDACQAFTVPRR